MSTSEGVKLKDKLIGTCTTCTATANAYVNLDLGNYFHVVSVKMQSTAAGLFTRIQEALRYT